MKTSTTKPVTTTPTDNEIATLVDLKERIGRPAACAALGLAPTVFDRAIARGQLRRGSRLQVKAAIASYRARHAQAAA